MSVDASSLGTATGTAQEVAAAVAAGRVTASEVIAATIERIARRNPALNAFTQVLSDRASAKAREVDAAIASGRSVGPLAGVPFAVKNLFDLEGVVTRAGSRINRDDPLARADAVVVRRLEAAGAVCVGALNMGEYAYDFTGENAHDGPCRNPHDTTRMAGGSSSGSGSAVAARLVPLALGSDTNGSIRVPAAFCGVFGLKPTYGRLPRTGTFPFVDSLDHVGPLACSTRDLTLAYDAMQGHDADDPVCADRPAEPVGTDAPALRVARLGGYFVGQGEAATDAAAERAAAALGACETVVLERAAEARAAAYVITNVEGAALHRTRLETRRADFDPAVRDRLLAGLLIPGVHYVRAQRLRRSFAQDAARLFARFDVLVAPATPFPAPAIGQQTVMIDGQEVMLRPNIGIYTQPISFIGLPVVVVPVPGEGLPLGVQLIGPPWREDLVLAAAAQLEAAGVARTPEPA